ncbi:MAG: flagellar biosynthesis protein FlhF [Deltaproteobacteria bacterium]|nr:flagellar biosynthesis protein FlhF [Deltaproteobacteria bacterium]
MQIKRYEVSKIQDAMQQIKNDLGPEAIILSTKTIKHSNPQKIEVIAAIDITELNNQIPGRAWCKEQDGERRNGSFGLPQGDVVRKYDEIQRILEKMGPVNDIREEIKSLKDNVELLVDVIGLARFRQESEHLAKMYQTLTANGISKGKTCHIIDEMRNGRLPENEKDYASCLKLAERTIASSLSKIDVISKTRRIKTFIGPTGVGKTTTLAKLAASFCVDKRKKVGLITMDTFRIAAVEQLKVYAKIIDVPLQVATSKTGFEKSLKALSDADVILVDTAGRSPNDAEFIKNIHETFSKNTGVEINLLLSPSMSRDHLLETENYYRLTEYNNLILTKVDECSRYGVIYDLVRHAGKPVGYLTTGQNVPQDIENATPEKLAKLIVQNSIH